ncbi:hypothetical protein AMTR_s00097p00149320 [Amborella trichopoda]|uniref:Plastid division protein PDV1 n=2 Tax=Amborella trichopoda TaxID=13333 RepID=W1P2B2_AMBTC|nr:hypothetical protein AMTR_s00097p00149320 [Amborella trichopoda]
MEAEDIEAVLERVWDLHDKISDAIHFISKTHLLNSISKPPPINTEEDAFSPEKTLKNEEQNNKFTNGFVFMKKENQAFDTDGLVAEARSLNAIRTALEDLEDQLEFFHTVQSQQRAERDVAMARLEQSRMVLAMRLADHRGKKYGVIEEALAFVGDVEAVERSVAPENLYEMPPLQSGEHFQDEEKSSSALSKMLNVAKNSVKLDRVVGFFGNVALIVIGMHVLLQLRPVAFRTGTTSRSSQFDEDSGFARGIRDLREVDDSFEMKGGSKRNDLSKDGRVKGLDVLLARG